MFDLNKKFVHEFEILSFIFWNFCCFENFFKDGNKSVVKYFKNADKTKAHAEAQ